MKPKPSHKNNQEVSNSSQHLLILLLITVIGASLRFYNLGNESLWLDEGYSAYMAQYASIKNWSQDIHPPLYYALLAAWSWFSNSDYWLRLLSLIFGVATIPVVYSLGRQLFGPRAALWSVLMLAVLSLHIRYSQDARTYTLMTFLFACALWSLVGIARGDNSWKRWLFYTISSILLTYTHGVGIIYVAALAVLFPLCTIDVNKAANWRPWLLSHAAVGVLFLPWLGIYMARSHEVTQHFWLTTPSWSDSLLVLSNLTVASIPSLSEIIRQHTDTIFLVNLPNWIWVLPIAVVLWQVIVKAGLDTDNIWKIRILVAAYALPIFIVFFISLTVKPIFLLRVFLPITIPVVLLLGSASVVDRKQSVFTKTALVLSVVILIVSTFYHLRYAQKEQWREASLYLQQSIAPSDVILYNIPDLSGKYLVNRYDAIGTLQSVAQIDIAPEIKSCTRKNVDECLDQAIYNYQFNATFWIVSSHNQFMADNLTISAWIKRNFVCQPLEMFNGVGIDQCKLASKDNK